MKAIPALALLAAVGVAVSGCGSGKKLDSVNFSVPTTTTVATVEPGAAASAAPVH